MKWILAQNWPSDDSVDKIQMAMLTNASGHVILFKSKRDAESFVEEVGESLDNILVIPEMEARLMD
jgi:hypothetical protein|tara:strand:+ start:946 stop:1143 length:198 start_codon:yes stop_codon:yes gene_type:complete